MFKLDFKGILQPSKLLRPDKKTLLCNCMYYSSDREAAQIEALFGFTDTSTIGSFRWCEIPLQLEIFIVFVTDWNLDISGSILL